MVNASTTWEGIDMRDRIGRVLLAICAIATLGAFAQGIQIMSGVSDERILTEAWRTFAYIIFAGLWAMLAISPRGFRGVWELLFAHKIAITLFAVAVIDKPGAVQHVIVDGTLVVVTGIAYVLCRGWLTWQRASQPRLVD
jgi:hypothetical protein